MVKLVYLRATRQNNPVGCVAYSCDDEGIDYNLSVLNPLDKFDRKLARGIATKRLDKYSYHLPINTKNMSNFDIMVEVIASISNNSALPKRAQKAAREWLKINDSYVNLVIEDDMTSNIDNAIVAA